MVKRTFTVTTKAGIHAGPAKLLVQSANKYDADVNVEYNSKIVYLKSMECPKSSQLQTGRAKRAR